jgi:hypothetical protein
MGFVLGVRAPNGRPERGSVVMADIVALAAIAVLFGVVRLIALGLERL